MAEQTFAWLLRCGRGYQIAVPEYQMVEYLQAPGRLNMPLAPAHCNTGILWRDHFVPVLDLKKLAGSRTASEIVGACVIAYQAAPRTALKYAAIANSGSPERISVDNEQFCPLPDDFPEAWRLLAMSCISINGVVTPVLDLAKLCSRQYLEQLAA